MDAVIRACGARNLPPRSGPGGVAGFHPRPISPQDGIDALETILDQDERRTGARFLSGSGAVGDDPTAGVELAETAVEFGQRDGEGAGDGAGGGVIRRQDVQEDGGSTVESGPGLGAG